MKRPQFLIVGAQKCGTNTLWELLKQHPDIKLPEHKEYHYFNRDLTWPNHLSYMVNFPDGGALTGEATPDYYFWPGAMERIHAYNPHMKIVMMLRDPVKRAISHYWMEYNRGFEQLPIEEALQPISHRELSLNYKGLYYSLFYHSYLLRGVYHTYLDEIYRLFDSDNVFVGRLEDLSEHPLEFFARLCTFLGVRTVAGITPITVFKGTYPEPEKSLLLRLYSYFGTANQLLHNKYLIKISDWRS